MEESNGESGIIVRVRVRVTDGDADKEDDDKIEGDQRSNINDVESVNTGQYT